MIHEALHIIHGNSSYGSILSDGTKIKENQSMPKIKSSPNVSLQNNAQLKRGTSFVVGQKLRESKWFGHDEIKILCAVLETGFIVELKEEGKENEFGITVWKSGYEKSKNPEYVQIYTIKLIKMRYKVCSYKLEDFWPEGTKIRINNQTDRDNVPHAEDVIRDQIAYAEKNKQKWHNSEHFVYWCRYEAPQVNSRMKQISDSMKWGNIGLNAGLHLLRSRKRSMNK